MCPRYLAIDMGAESSRAIVGHFEDDKLRLEEIHRWPSRNVEVRGSRYWDILYLYGKIKHALSKYSAKYGPELAGIGVDSWGVDYGILGESDQLLQNPVQYRDHRTDGLVEKASDVMSKEDIYSETGIAFMQFNTLYQLWAMHQSAPEVLREGKTFLMMSDLLHYFLSGVAKCEYTNASTTQLLDIRTGRWSKKIFDAFRLPIEIMPEVVHPGTILGPLDETIAEESNLSSPSVITPCTHDTACAVLAVPAREEDWIYISCGTWSLMGAELKSPITNPDARECNFTNEGGHAGTICFLKNIMGLWVLQHARSAWAKRDRNFEYTELIEMARSAEPFAAILNIDDQCFYNPDDMLDAIAAQCRETNQNLPEDIGTTVRVILEGLALSYAVTMRELERITGCKFKKVHMVGGGIQNDLLCQLASNATGRPVIAGPVEGTAMGNIATQAIATGYLSDRAEARSLIARSTEVKLYEPEDSQKWQDLVGKFSK